MMIGYIACASDGFESMVFFHTEGFNENICIVHIK